MCHADQSDDSAIVAVHGVGALGDPAQSPAGQDDADLGGETAATAQDPAERRLMRLLIVRVDHLLELGPRLNLGMEVEPRHLVGQGRSGQLIGGEIPLPDDGTRCALRQLETSLTRSQLRDGSLFLGDVDAHREHGRGTLELDASGRKREPAGRAVAPAADTPRNHPPGGCDPLADRETRRADPRW